MPEIWKDVVGYEGLYQVSNRGRIKSVERFCKSRYGIRKVPERIRKLSYDNYGYLMVSLYKDGVKNPAKVHRIVAKAFIPNPGNFTQVNHIDENKENNCVDNLEWCTVEQNNNHGTRNLRIRRTQQKTLLQFDLDGNLVKEWNGVNEMCQVTGYNEGFISKVIRGQSRAKTAYGYKWAYKK